MMIPQESWVTKWQRIGKFLYTISLSHTLSLSLFVSLCSVSDTCKFHPDRNVPGCYAMSVSGDLPQDIIDSLQDKGVPYISRDTSNRN